MQTSGCEWLPAESKKGELCRETVSPISELPGLNGLMLICFGEEMRLAGR